MGRQANPYAEFFPVGYKRGSSLPFTARVALRLIVDQAL